VARSSISGRYSPLASLIRAWDLSKALGCRESLCYNQEITFPLPWILSPPKSRGDTWAPAVHLGSRGWGWSANRKSSEIGCGEACLKTNTLTFYLPSFSFSFSAYLSYFPWLSLAPHQGGLGQVSHTQELWLYPWFLPSSH
jgi:hypothetical protein